MKLVLCRYCCDVFKLAQAGRRCECGKSSGRYMPDGLHAEIHGKGAVALGLGNMSLSLALLNRRGSMALDFKAFVIPERSATIRRSRKALA